MKKYELTLETLQFAGHTLHRIKALKDFGVFTAGELGGWIESEENLSQADNAWVYGDAKAYANAKVYGNAELFGDARVGENAELFDNAKVFGNAKVHGKAVIYSDAIICDNATVFGNVWVRDQAVIGGNAKVCDNADYIVFKNFWSSGRYFTWTRSNNKWSVGCFYGTGEELIKKAYADSEKSGREYERVVRYVESILADEKRGKEIDRMLSV